jgi:hypothetical protein
MQSARQTLKDCLRPTPNYKLPTADCLATMEIARTTVPCPSLKAAPPASSRLHGVSESNKDEPSIPLQNCRPSKAEIMARYLALLDEMECKEGRASVSPSAISNLKSHISDSRNAFNH